MKIIQGTCLPVSCILSVVSYSKTTQHLRNWIYSCSQLALWGGTYCLDQIERATINHVFSD
jgi:hypothetical protein